MCTHAKRCATPMQLYELMWPVIAIVSQWLFRFFCFKCKRVMIFCVFVCLSVSCVRYACAHMCVCCVLGYYIFFCQSFSLFHLCLSHFIYFWCMQVTFLMHFHFYYWFLDSWALSSRTLNTNHSKDNDCKYTRSRAHIQKKRNSPNNARELEMRKSNFYTVEVKRCRFGSFLWYVMSVAERFFSLCAFAKVSLRSRFIAVNSNVCISLCCTLFFCS